MGIRSSSEKGVRWSGHARPKSMLETDFVENYKEGIVLEGFEYPEDYDVTNALTTTWKELSEKKPVRVSSIYEDYGMAMQDLRDEMELAEVLKVASFTRGEPVIYFVRPDEIASSAGYIIAWIDDGGLEDSHLELGLSESRNALMKTDWDKWYAKATRLSGLSSLDGDENIDGYSLDSAYKEFEKGVSPEDYVKNHIGFKKNAEESEESEESDDAEAGETEAGEDDANQEEPPEEDEGS